MLRNEKPGGNRAGGKGGGQSQLQYTTSKGGGVPICVGSTVVGTVKGDTFYKRVKASAHFLHKPAAIAFDISTLKDAERAGARRVEIEDAESGQVWKASIRTIWERGRPLNRGCGPQWMMTLEEWRKAQFPTQGRLF